ncbi:hypothetical protein BKA93DRAFT_612895 [Sparassis latifolia]
MRILRRVQPFETSLRAAWGETGGARPAAFCVVVEAGSVGGQDVRGKTGMGASWVDDISSFGRPSVHFTALAWRATEFRLRRVCCSVNFSDLLCLFARSSVILLPFCASIVRLRFPRSPVTRWCRPSAHFAAFAPGRLDSDYIGSAALSIFGPCFTPSRGVPPSERVCYFTALYC